MMSHVNLNNANASPNHVENVSMLASFYSWYFIHLVADVIEFLCLSAAKLIVLDLMSVFAAPKGARLQMQWAAAGRVVMAAAVLGIAAGLAANAAAAVQYQKGAQA
jgi:hypothetical protein